MVNASLPSAISGQSHEPLECKPLNQYVTAQETAREPFILLPATYVTMGNVACVGACVYRLIHEHLLL